MTPTLSLVPPESRDTLKGKPLEDAARAELKRAIGLTVNVNAPSWRDLVFFGAPIAFRTPRVPPGVAGRIGALNADAFSKDGVGLAALALAEKLQQAKPGGTFRRSVVPGKPMPAAPGARDDWDRQVFLVTGGPDVVPLLVAGNYLLGPDLDVFEDTAPEGLDAQRIDAVEAATVLTQAANRSGHDPDLPDWLNSQILSLMGEETPSDIFQALYAKPQQQQNQGPSASGARSKIADAYRPTPGTGDATQ